MKSRRRKPGASKPVPGAIDRGGAAIGLKPSPLSDRSVAAREAQAKGVAFHLAGQLDGALAAYDQALALGLVDADLYYNRALVHHTLGHYAQALADYDATLALDPSSAEVWENRGVALHKLSRPAEALDSYAQALERAAPTAQLLTNQGVSYYAAQAFEAALDCYARAHGLDPHYAPLYTNRGNTLRLLGRFDEALADFDRALMLQPVYAEAWGNRAATLHEAGRLHEARLAYETGIQRYPAHVETRWNRSLLMLLTGDFATGWTEYESRWARPGNEPDRHLSLSKWLGESDISGKTVLVYPEQGLGDFLQFFRYVNELIAIGARVVLETPPPLASLVQASAARWPPAMLQVVVAGNPLPPADARIPIMSLPLAFATQLESLPSRVPYLLAPQDRITYWRERLGPPKRLRVGLAWSGSPTHRNDYNRSIGLSTLANLFEEPCEFHCLQKLIRDTDRAWLQENGGIVRHDDAIHDFADTAALAQAMDLIISVDTSVAHLAGALGKPLFLMLPFAPDFRWLLDRCDSPWYPSARLFRQSRPGEWAPVIEQVRNALRHYKPAA